MRKPSPISRRLAGRKQNRATPGPVPSTKGSMCALPAGQGSMMIEWRDALEVYMKLQKDRKALFHFNIAAWLKLSMCNVAEAMDLKRDSKEGSRGFQARFGRDLWLVRSLLNCRCRVNVGLPHHQDAHREIGGGSKIAAMCTQRHVPRQHIRGISEEPSGPTEFAPCHIVK